MKNSENAQEFITFVEDRPYNDKRYYISNDKLKKLGWSPTIAFIDGLKDLIDKKMKKE